MMWFIGSLPRTSTLSRHRNRAVTGSRLKFAAISGCFILNLSSGPSCAAPTEVVKPPAPAPSSTSDGYRPLTNADLRKLVAQGASFRALPAGRTNSVSQHEIFFPDGRWLGCGDRGMPEARYAIEGRRLCLVGKGAPSCRLIFRNVAGAYRQQAIRSDGAALPYTEVQIQPAEPGERCISTGVSQ